MDKSPVSEVCHSPTSQPASSSCHLNTPRSDKKTIDKVAALAQNIPPSTVATAKNNILQEKVTSVSQTASFSTEEDRVLQASSPPSSQLSASFLDGISDEYLEAIDIETERYFLIDDVEEDSQAMSEVPRKNTVFPLATTPAKNSMQSKRKPPSPPDHNTRMLKDTKDSITTFAREITPAQSSAAKRNLVPDGCFDEPASSPCSTGTDEDMPKKSQARKDLILQHNHIRHDQIGKLKYEPVYEPEARERWDKSVNSLANPNLLHSCLFDSNEESIKKYRLFLQNTLNETNPNKVLCYGKAKVGLWDSVKNTLMLYPDVLKNMSVNIPKSQPQKNTQQTTTDSKAAKSVNEAATISEENIKTRVYDEGFTHAERSVVVRTALRADKIAQRVLQATDKQENTYIVIMMIGRYYSCNLCHKALKIDIEILQEKIRSRLENPLNPTDSSKSSKNTDLAKKAHLIFVYNNVEFPYGKESKKKCKILNDVYFSSSAIESLTKWTPTAPPAAP